MIDAEAAALDHRRAAHADRGVLGGDDDVAAAEQRGVAGEAVAGDDADHRHQAGQLCELHEGRPVEAGHAEPVGVAGTAAAALGEEHQRQPPLLGEAEHAVDLLVVHVALGAGQHGVVVGDHHAAGGVRAEFFRVDGGDAGDQAVGRRVADEVVDLAPPALRGDRQRAVFDEGAVVDELRDVLARGALVGLAAALDRGRAVLVQRDGVARDQFGEIGPDVVEIDILFLGRRHGRRPRPARDSRMASSCISVAPASPTIFVTLPPCGAVTRCSIFMASSTAICWPGRTRSPSLTSIVTMVPCSGAGTAHRAGRPGRPMLRPRLSASAVVVGGIAGFDQRSAIASAVVPASPTRSATWASMKPVLMRLATKSGCARSAARNGMLVATPRCGTRAGCARPCARRRPVRRRRMHDHLGEQRVEGRAGPVAGIAERIDAHAGAGRQVEQRRACRRSAWSPPVSSIISMLTRSCIA